MPSRKSHKLLITVIILTVFLLILIGIAILYFSTDFFKSNKQLYSNYMTQIGKEQEGFIDDKLKEYFSKKESTQYKNTSEISFDIKNSTDSKKYENVNKMNISFSGEIDNANETNLQNVSINYSENTTFPFVYKKQNTTEGIQTDYIGSKYVGVDLATDENNIVEEIPELRIVKQIPDMFITQEDLQYANDMYLSTFNIQIEKDAYGKIQEADNNSYRLTLKGQNLKEVLKNLLEKLKNDATMLEKLNLYIKTLSQNSNEITVEDIEGIIQEIDADTTYDDKNLEITVSQSKGIVNKLSIVSELLEINIEKISEQNQLQYIVNMQLNLQDKPLTVELKAQYTGLQSSEKVTENYDLTIQNDGTTYNYIYNDVVEFTQGLESENFDENNSIILNNMDEEARKSLVNAIKDRIKTVNAEQMQTLQLEENQNPFQYVMPQLEIFKSEKKDEKQINEVDVNEFNTKFENYASANLQGVTVKGLLTTISLNNGLEDADDNGNTANTGNTVDSNNTDDSNNADDANNEKVGKNNAYLIEEIHFDGAEYEVNRQNIATIKSSIETESYYRVQFEKNSDTGIIYRVVINKK